MSAANRLHRTVHRGKPQLRDCAHALASPRSVRSSADRASAIHPGLLADNGCRAGTLFRTGQKDCGQIGIADRVTEYLKETRLPRPLLLRTRLFTPISCPKKLRAGQDRERPGRECGAVFHAFPTSGIEKGLASRLSLLDTGGSGEIRTRDQRIKSPLLYRLSYRPVEPTLACW